MTKIRLVALFGLAFFLFGCSEPEVEVAQEAIARPVKLLDIGASDDESVFRFPAVVGASRISDLSFLVSGRVQKVLVKEAEEVVAGQVIARLETRDFKNKVASTKASSKNAEEEYQRANRLFEQDAIAKSVVEQRQAQRDVASAQLDTAQKALSDSVLIAPFSGVVASVTLRETENVSPGGAAATIIDVTSLDATVNLPASLIAQVPTREDRGALVVLDSVPDAPIEAVFKEANLVGDATSQTYAVTFSFSAPENLLVLPGMNATVLLTSAPTPDAPSTVSAPLSAVLSDSNGEYVWLLEKESMTVSRRDIEIEPGIGENVRVSSGLVRGDQIVGAGGAYLTEGTKVTAWQ